MIHKLEKNNKKAFTLVEMIIAFAILSFLAIYAWRIYFSGSETMRHTVTQSQIQADIRLFLDKLEAEMMACYIFETVDTENKKFSFYTFTYGKKSLDDIYYDREGKPYGTGSDSQQSIKVLRIEYSWEDGKVTKKRTPGWLYFLRSPMVFQADPTSNAFTDDEKEATTVPLKEISEFEVKGYYQKKNNESDTGFDITPVTTETARSTTFIVLRIHALKDEVGSRRDEEIDVVTKFYSSIRLAEEANPGYFCSTDRDGSF